jgi:hypothetical protein
MGAGAACFYPMQKQILKEYSWLQSISLRLRRNLAKKPLLEEQIGLHEDRFTVQRDNYLRRRAVIEKCTVEWSQITEIIARRVDVWAYDLFEITVKTAQGQVAWMEDATGMHDWLDELPGRLQGAKNSLDTLISAFEDQLVLFKRA